MKLSDENNTALLEQRVQILERLDDLNTELCLLLIRALTAALRSVAQPRASELKELLLSELVRLSSFLISGRERNDALISDLERTGLRPCRTTVDGEGEELLEKMIAAVGEALEGLGLDRGESFRA